MKPFPGRLPLVLAIAIAATALTMPDAPAHTGATGVVRDRMDMMKSMASAMKRIHGELRSADPASSEIADAARKISAHGKRIAPLFPKHSGGHPSEASPRIWEEPGAFRKHASALVDAAEKLADAATGGDRDSLTAAFRAVGATCSGCHRDYRIRNR